MIVWVRVDSFMSASLVPRPHPQGERIWCHKSKSLG